MTSAQLAAEAPAGTLITPTRDASGAYVTDVDPVATGVITATATTANPIKVSNYTVTLGSTSYVTDANTQVFYYEGAFKTDNVDGGPLNELAGKVGSIIATKAPTSDVLTAIYVYNA